MRTGQLNSIEKTLEEALFEELNNGRLGNG